MPATRVPVAVEMHAVGLKRVRAAGDAWAVATVGSLPMALRCVVQGASLPAGKFVRCEAAAVKPLHLMLSQKVLVLAAAVVTVVLLLHGARRERALHTLLQLSGGLLEVVLHRVVENSGLGAGAHGCVVADAVQPLSDGPHNLAR